jgi:peroxiredoxin
MLKVLRELGVLVGVGIITAAGTHAFRENRTLRERNERLTSLLTEPQRGSYVPAMEASLIDGTPVVLGEIGHRQLLFFFNTSCPHCSASLSSWNRIADRLQSDSTLTVLGVGMSSVEHLEAYVSQNDLAFRVVAKPDPRLVDLYRVHGVPLTLLLTEEARVEYARFGALGNPGAVDSVLAAAQDRVFLPGAGG